MQFYFSSSEGEIGPAFIFLAQLPCLKAHVHSPQYKASGETGTDLL